MSCDHYLNSLENILTPRTVSKQGVRRLRNSSTHCVWNYFRIDSSCLPKGWMDGWFATAEECTTDITIIYCQILKKREAIKDLKTTRSNQINDGDCISLVFLILFSLFNRTQNTKSQG